VDDTTNERNEILSFISLQQSQAKNPLTSEQVKYITSPATNEGYPQHPPRKLDS